jgi:hypothetical protein
MAHFFSSVVMYMDIEARRKRQNVTTLLSSTIIKYHKVEKDVFHNVT